MEKHAAGLLGALAGLASMGTAQAALPATAPAQVMQVSTYAELLSPIPNAASLLASSNAELAANPPRIVETQYYQNGGPPHHHHHHHHSYRPPLPPPPHHHHHHHHHGGVTMVVPGIGAVHTN